jgi:hypothetical protein
MEAVVQHIGLGTHSAANFHVSSNGDRLGTLAPKLGGIHGHVMAVRDAESEPGAQRIA